MRLNLSFSDLDYQFKNNADKASTLGKIHSIISKIEKVEKLVKRVF